jgi:hypothetical protein
MGAAAFALVATAAAVTPAVAGAAGSASGNSGNSGSGSGQSAAVVGPLLQMFEFGNQVGLPLMCSDSGSIVSIIGAQTQTSSVTSPLVTQLDSQCAQLSSQGGGFLQQAMTESRSLNMINPAVNPLIADLDTGLVTVGTQYGGSMAPFGPTVVGLGGTVAFFEGT